MVNMATDHIQFELSSQTHTIVIIKEFYDGVEWGRAVFGCFRTSSMNLCTELFGHILNFIVVCWNPHAV